MSGTRLTQIEFLTQHRGHVQALEFEAETLLAEGADALSVVGALLWTAALVAEQRGICPERFLRLVDAMVDSAVEPDDDDDIGPTAGEA